MEALVAGSRPEAELVRTRIRRDGQVAYVTTAGVPDVPLKEAGTPTYDGLPLGAWTVRGAQTAIPNLVGARAELGLDLRCIEGFHDVRVELRDDFSWRAGGRHDAEPTVGGEAVEARLRHRGEVRQHRRAA